MKIDRHKVLDKYAGRCAYCGIPIDFRTMQIDHIIAQRNSYKEPNLDPNRLSNLNPSCRKCNNFKHSWTIEEMRHELSMQVKRLKRVSQFDRALRFGQVTITELPVVFYFETYRQRNY